MADELASPTTEIGHPPSFDVAGKTSGCLSFCMVMTERYVPAIQSEKLIMYHRTKNTPQQKAHPNTSRDFRARLGKQYGLEA